MGATELISELRSRVERELSFEKSTKRSALRIALIGAIRDGVLKPDERLPPEVHLASAVGLSLGTVQSALGQLQDLGMIVRRRGGGTRVAGSGPISPSVWHFRFRLRESGQAILFIEQTLDVSTTRKRGIWSDHLGEAEEYVVLRRRFTAQNGLRLGAEMYLDTTLLASTNISTRELQSTNLRMLLESRLGVTSSHVSHEVVLMELCASKAESFQMAVGQSCFRLEARTTTNTAKPFYYQEVYAPAEAVSLSF